VQAVLVLPEGTNVTSGNNRVYIGSISGGTSTTAIWIVTFQKNGTFTLQVNVSGYDSNDNPCTVSQSTIITVGKNSPNPTLFDAFYVFLITACIATTIVLLTALVLRRRKRVIRGQQLARAKVILNRVKSKRFIEAMESAMKRRIWISILLVLVASISAIVFFRSYILQPVEAGFMLYSLQNNALLISDADILSYNWTSQEIAITVAASARLAGLGDNLYSFSTGFVIKIDEEEIYRGIFRAPYMSAIPEPPRISILFPSVLFPSETKNYGAVRMFYPTFQPINSDSTDNAKILSYFEKVNKLEY
jgi:hypothetical protein